MTMVVLGLGSNLDDKLANLRKALAKIKDIPGMNIQQVSPVYLSEAELPENTLVEWNLPYFNIAIRCEVTSQPLELLEKIKNIETQIGRNQKNLRWAPRSIDIDILGWDNLVMDTEKLTIPHKHLLNRPFALWPLADVAPWWKYQDQSASQLVEKWDSRFSGEAPFHTHQIFQRVDTPELVGIINTTPDSFTDGGQFLATDTAIQQVMHLVYSGATVLDVGAESTAPSAQAIDAETEWERLKPILEAINAVKNNLFLIPKISIDTRHAEVAAKALDLGVDWINDVTGLDDPKMREIVASSRANCVVMHHLSIPERREHVLPQNEDPLKMVLRWGENRLAELEKEGIARDKIIFDPGIGFGKTAEQSFYLLQHIDQLATLGTRLLVGHSRKSYLSLFTDLPFSERDIETTTVSLFLAKQPVHYLRLHHVEMCARAFKVQAALEEGSII